MKEKYKIALRFCGGCNPYFDRAKLYEDVKTEFSSVCDFELFHEDQKYDIVLLINGCSSECLMEEDYDADLVVLHDRNYKDYKAVIQSAMDKVIK
jgi:4-hydroxybutyrate CoA-transferase